MANTIEIIIVCNDEENVVKNISEQTNLPILKMVDNENATNDGTHTMYGLSVFGFCGRCITKEEIEALKLAFLNADFLQPELAVMIISDDNDTFNGIVTHGLTHNY